jgi:hypothetical protein
MADSDLVILVTRDAVSINGLTIPGRPTRDELQQALPPSAQMSYQKGPAYLPAAIFDDLGLLARYLPETNMVALLDVFFATSGRDHEPKQAFTGQVILNGQVLKRPVPMKSISSRGEFTFDDKLTPSAGPGSIGVSIVPKFEYLGVLTIGWKTDLPERAYE